MSAFSSGMISAPVAPSRSVVSGATSGCENVSIDVLAVGRDLHRVRAVVGRQRDVVLAVEPDLVEVREVRILSLLLADRVEPHRPRRAIEPGDARDRPDAGRDLVLQLAGLEIVEIHLRGAVALRVPEHLVRVPENLPLHARLHVRLLRLGEERPHFAGRRRRRAWRWSSCGTDRSRRTRAAMPSGLQRYSPMSMLSSDIARWKSGAISRRVTLPVSTSMIDAGDHRDVRIAGERILPRAQHRMAAVDRRLDEVHVADLPLVLLLRRDLLAVGRPRQRRRRARRPAGVARRVAEVLHAVGRELALLAGGDVAHPEIPVADEDAPCVPSGDIDAGGGPVMPGDVGAAGLRDRDAAAAPAAAAGHRRRRARRGRPPPATPDRRPAASPPTSRVFFTGSMTTFSVPVSVVRTYQKRPSGSQVAFDGVADDQAVQRGREHLDRAIVVGGRDHAPGFARRRRTSQSRQERERGRSSGSWVCSWQPSWWPAPRGTVHGRRFRERVSGIGGHYAPSLDRYAAPNPITFVTGLLGRTSLALAITASVRSTLGVSTSTR